MATSESHSAAQSSIFEFKISKKDQPTEELSHTSLAPQYCKPIDLRNEFGNPRDQGNVNWCYANAAADLLTHYYRKTLEYPVSAKELALGTSLNWSGNEYREFGSMLLSLSYGLNNGFCPNNIDSIIFGSRPDFKLYEKINTLYWIKDRLKKGQKNQAIQSLISAQKKGLLFPTIKYNEVIGLLNRFDEKRMINDLYAYFCQNSRINVVSKPKIIWESILRLNNKDQLLKTLNKKLSLKTPVAISYFVGFFKNDESPKSASDLHESIIVGRRWNDKSKNCEYLIRNTWSTRCTGYANPRIRSACDRGNLWLDEKTLKDNLIGLTFLQGT